MSRLVLDLENVLQLLVEEHKRMLGHVAAQQSAMKALQLDAMQDAAQRQESSRLRIASLETRRKTLVIQIARLARLSTNITLKDLAANFPQNARTLLAMREELRALMQEVSERTHVAGRLAAAVLGHLNTAMRLFAGAVGQNGTYTKTGAPRVAQRIGVMDAVG
jgi:hypothetical protein